MEACKIFFLCWGSWVVEIEPNILNATSVQSYMLTLRVQVHNIHILPPNLHYNSYYPELKYLIIGYLDPLG